jgi:glycosyltransferase involved in cell wall biosynthesis
MPAPGNPVSDISIPDISVIVPLHNEEENVGLLHSAVSAVLDGMGRSYELVLVDDGSTDATFARAEAIARADRRVRIVRFRRNFGQTMAMVAGFDHARGRVLVTMDGDLQNEPGDIPALVAKLEEGYDLVAGWRDKRQDRFLSRKLPSLIANRLIARVTGVPIRDNGCSLKAYRAELIRHVPLYSEMHRLIPAMAHLSGARIAEVKTRHHARRFGQSKYGLSRTYKVMLDLLSVKVLHLASARPLLWAASAAGLTWLVAFGFFVEAMRETYLTTGGVPTVLFGVALLWGTVGAFSLCAGMVAELAIATGGGRHDFLPALTARLKQGQEDRPVGPRAQPVARPVAGPPPRAASVLAVPMKASTP